MRGLERMRKGGFVYAAGHSQLPQAGRGRHARPHIRSHGGAGASQAQRSGSATEIWRLTLHSVVLLFVPPRVTPIRRKASALDPSAGGPGGKARMRRCRRVQRRLGQQNNRDAWKSLLYTPLTYVVEPSKHLGFYASVTWQSSMKKTFSYDVSAILRSLACSINLSSAPCRPSAPPPSRARAWSSRPARPRPPCAAPSLRAAPRRPVRPAPAGTARTAPRCAHPLQRTAGTVHAARAYARVRGTCLIQR